MTMRNWVPWAVLAVLASAVMAGAAAAQTSKPLRVGIATVYKPLAFKEGGQLQGVEVDFARRLGEDLQREAKLIELPWDDLIPALREGRVDVIMSGMSITKERSKVVSFASPYLQVGQMALIRRDDATKFLDFSAMNLPTTRIGAQRNTTGEFYARRELAKAQIKPYDSVEAGLAALRAKEIDFFVHDAPTIWRIRGREKDQNQDLVGRYRLLTEEYLGWAVRRDDAALRDRLNATLEQWRDSDWLESVLDRWIPVRKIEVPVPQNTSAG